MRKWHYFAIGAAIVSCVGGYWYFANPAIEPSWHNVERPGFTKLTKQASPDNGNAEESDAIEPLIVDHGLSPISVPPGLFAGPLPRVEDNASAPQPPRPDAKRRMPYADEALVVAPLFDPIVWIMESKLPDLKLFDDPAEESEPREISPPVWHPHAYPHCPYTGGCPVPSRYPLIPRD